QNSRSPFAYARHMEPVMYLRQIASIFTGFAF
ncbi:hypothetical protein D030_1395B, partial [Vibrio parahaemolyticus AQ3810]